MDAETTDGGLDGPEDAAATPDDAVVDARVDAAPDATTLVDASAADMGPVPCDPPLTLTPESAFSPAYDVVIFSASGGSGTYRFDVVGDESGALINDLSGAYLAGPTEGVTDVVRVTDLNCEGEATAEVYVVLPLELRPQEVRVIPGTEIRFDSFGGSRMVEYRPLLIRSGGMISPEGVYVAGLELGQDIIAVTDVLTGLEVEAFIDVVESDRLVPQPSRLFTTPGDVVPMEIAGGSGFVDHEIDESVARFDEARGVVEGVGPGRTVLALTDRYTGIRIDVTIDVSPVLSAEMVPSGRNMNQSIVRGVGDLNGDGFNDAVIGFPEANIDAFSDGAVMVYAGGEDGLGTQPVQVLGGATGRDAQAGRGLAVADFDGDGQMDLAIGILNNDEAGGNAGAVHIHAGVADGFFTEEATLKMFPVRGGDQLGFHVEACDFNGDGFMDLAANAQRYEARDYMPNNADVGAVFLYLGGPEGLNPAHLPPIPVLDLDDVGDLTFVPQMRVGEAMTTGDFDGDGHCDLAISRVNWPTTENYNRGAVFLYSGYPAVDDPEYPDPGGLDPSPARIITGVDGQGNSGASFGRRLAAGDLNGDGRDELLIASHAFDFEGNDRGNVDVFSGGPLAGPVRTYTSAADADFSLQGSDPGDNFGIAVSADDVNGDGLDDVIVGAWYDEVVGEEIPVNTGAFSIFPGVMDGWPAAEPVTTIAGAVAGSLFGEALAHVGDVDGDGLGDFVVTLPRDHTYGARVGRAEYISGDGERRGWLDLVSNPSGARFGIDAAFGDLTGDGIADLVVGAPEVGLAPDQVRPGEVYIYAGTEGGFETTPSVTVTGFTGHTIDDRFGTGTAVGDFNGDGRADLAVAAQSDERGSVWEDGTFVEVGDCSNRNNSGSISVFLGGPDGLTLDAPDFVMYGPRTNSNVNHVDFADVNGDGLDDVLLGATFDDTGGRDRGRVQVFFGRAADAGGRTSLVCDTDFDFAGQGNREGIGFVYRLADLNDDGCEEFAIGAPPADHGDEVDQGLVRVIYGWGGAQCPASARMLVFGGASRSDLLGRGVTAHNLVGDERPELIVSGVNVRNPDNNQRSGGVYIISGERLAGLQLQPAAAGERRVESVGVDDDIALYGDFSGQQFGSELVALSGRLVVGVARDQVGEIRQIGGARIYGFTAGLPELLADLVLETSRFEGRLGDTMAIDPTRGYLAIGGHLGEATGPENGAVYYFNLSEL